MFFSLCAVRTRLRLLRCPCTVRPHQVEIRVQALRGVKDKLRADTYILLLSKWTKLGGDTVRWTDANVYSEDPPYCPLHDPLKLNQQYFEMRESCEICQV